MKAGLIVFLCLMLLPLTACKAGGSETIKIRTAAGTTVMLRVDVAITPEDQAQGLMNRESLDDDYGMLFLFPDAKERKFWMKDTLVPLDMIFIRSGGTVSRVHPNAIPHDLTPVPSNGPAVAVLEVRGGQAEKLGIKPGDVVEYKAFAR